MKNDKNIPGILDTKIAMDLKICVDLMSSC